jgi:hypothetical protein
VIEALGRFSYVAMRMPTRARRPAEDARAFVEASEAAGAALIAPRRRSPEGSRSGRGGSNRGAPSGVPRPDIRFQDRGVHDGRRSPLSSALAREGPQTVPQAASSRFSRQGGQLDPDEPLVEFRGEDPAMAAAFLMSLEEQGLVAIGGDPFQETGYDGRRFPAPRPSGASVRPRCSPQSSGNDSAR